MEGTVVKQDEGRARIIDGKAIAASLREEVAARVAKLETPPGLAVILVGEDPASQVYVRNKEKAVEKAGMTGFSYRLPGDVPPEDLLALVEQLNQDPKVHGILVQLPLPAHLDEDAVINAIDPAKDVDGLHPVNAGKLAAGQGGGLVPCTPKGCLHLLKTCLGDLSGKKALVIGRSRLVGRPVALLLLDENCTVTLAHSKTQNLAEECRQADILIAAVGRPGLIRGNWVKPGATVIDVGINRLEDGTLAGDVAFDEALAVAGAITPVPGGVGPMTIACLLQNTLEAALAAATVPAPR